MVAALTRERDPERETGGAADRDPGDEPRAADTLRRRRPPFERGVDRPGGSEHRVRERGGACHADQPRSDPQAARQRAPDLPATREDRVDLLDDLWIDLPIGLPIGRVIDLIVARHRRLIPRLIEAASGVAEAPALGLIPPKWDLGAGGHGEECQ